MSKSLITGIIAGLVAGLLMGLLWRLVPGLTGLFNGWHTAITGGVCGAAAVIAMQMSGDKTG